MCKQVNCNWNYPPFFSFFKLNYKFDCGSGPALLISDKKINDDEWHIVIFKRQGNYGELIVDEDEAVTGYSQGIVETMNVNPPFYVGGVLQDMSTKVFNTIVSNYPQYIYAWVVRF